MGFKMLISNLINHINKVSPSFTPTTILDIGSRDGYQSIEFNSVYPNAAVHAFEPNPEQFTICVNNTTGYHNIHIHNLALSDVSGEMDFYVTHGNVGASSLLVPLSVPFGTSNDFTKISVKTVKLGDWLDDNHIEGVDILWLDTQGVELSVLKSMGDKIKNVRFIHCESAQSAYYDGHILRPELEAYLHMMGFSTEFNQPSYHPFGEGDIIATNNY